MGLAIAFVVVLVAFPAVVYGVEYTVGDTQGWNQGVNYSTWASGKTFTVGDTLVFNFLSNHQVSEVDQADYNGCSSINLVKNYDSSPAKITLTKAGKSFYICPTPGHCDNGMKLMVTAVAAGPPSGTPPSTSPTTPAPAPPTPTPSPPTTTPTPPKSAPAPPPTTPAPPTSTPTPPKSAPAPTTPTPTPPTTTPSPPTATAPAKNISPPPAAATPKTSPASGLYMSLAGVPVVLATLVAFMG